MLQRVNADFKIDIKDYRKGQKDSIIRANEGDVLCVLPTGYGKTLIIQSLPYLSKSSTAVIVVNGLRSIIEEQRAKFGDKCIFVDELFVKRLSEPAADQKQVFVLTYMTIGCTRPDSLVVTLVVRVFVLRDQYV